ncbi:hypothetical protein HYU14_02470 [Candidatus Woesearchaeota archaeon]|nr:hypothetical protein [Candidatus Woesearchaeota archaeon]
MEFVLDADIISTFAKVNRLSLLKSAFGRQKILVPPAVRIDLRKSKHQTVRESAASPLFTSVELTDAEAGLLNSFSGQQNLGRGELEGIALAKSRNAVFVSNDLKAIHFAEKLRLEVIDLQTILFSLKEIIPKQSLRELSYDIEKKDRVIIPDKEEILS